MQADCLLQGNLPCCYSIQEQLFDVSANEGEEFKGLYVEGRGGVMSMRAVP